MMCSLSSWERRARGSESAWRGDLILLEPDGALGDESRSCHLERLPEVAGECSGVTKSVRDCGKGPEGARRRRTQNRVPGHVQQNGGGLPALGTRARALVPC